MSAVYPPEYQQSPPQPPPEVRPPPRGPHRVRKVLLIVGGAFLALILVIVIISLATGGNKITPTAAPATSAAAKPATAQSYTDVQSLIAAMATHGAVCSNATFSTGGITPGATSGAGCDGASAGDTAIVVFTDHASALAYANSMISLSVANSLGPTAEVVGPNWTVNTVPAFAPKVVKAVGGQLITAPTSAATSAPATSAPATSAPATSAPATSAPATPTPATATATAPSMTVAQQQAVSAAQGYLSLGSGFSEQGLFKQLTSSYGSGFSASDANFAISYLHPDWDAQAVEAAKGYLALGTGFSRDSLIQQLTSSYGSGFTYSQAEYAATQVGL